MSYRLTLEKGVRFALYCDEDFVRTAYSIPTSRKAPRQDHITFKANIEVMRALQPHIADGSVSPDRMAARILDRLHRQYVDQRRAIRSSEIHFKRGDRFTLDLPMKHKPYNHQGRAIGFSLPLDASSLLMDTGTGKTYCSIATAGIRYQKKKVKRLLVTCPKSAIPVWQRQYKEHADYDYSLGVAKSELPQMDPKGLQVIVTNYDRLKRLKRSIERWKPDMLVADESQRIKKRTSIRSKVMHSLGDQIPNRMILTATLLGQKPVDAWSQYRFMNPDVFGRDYRDFEERYVIKGGYMGYEIKGYKHLDEFAERIHSSAFRCKLSECVDMPKESYVRLYCEAGPETKRIYHDLKLDFLAHIGDDTVSVELAISQLIKLRQLTGGLVKTDGGEIRKVSEEKAGLLSEHMEDRVSEKTVIFCSFLHEVELAMRVCKNLGIKARSMTGATSTTDRGILEHEFQKTDRFQALVCQIDVGGESLDMFAADQAVFYSPTFSFIKYHQAKGRIFRLGQTKPVAYVHLLMKGTVDEEIMDFIEQHGDLTTKILDDMRDYRLRRH